MSARFVQGWLYATAGDDRFTLSGPARKTLREAAYLAGWLTRQADYRAVAESGPPDLDDLAAVTDLAADLGVSNQVVSMWHKRYADFPPAVVTVARGQVALYSRRAVREWFEARKATAPPHWARRRVVVKP